MLRLLRKRFRGWGVKSAEFSRSRLALELLEQRVLLSVVVDEFGVLTINCDDEDNNVTVSAGSSE